MKMFCLGCGNELKGEAKFCDKCGQKIESLNTKYVIGDINSQPMKIPKKKKGCLIVALLFLLIPTLVLIIGIKNAPESAKVPENIGLIMKQTGANKEQANQINNIIEQCNIENIKEISHDEILDSAYGGNEKGYRLKTDSIGNIVVYLREDSTVLTIKYIDNVLYDNNEVVSKLSDYTFKLDEETNFQINSQKMVKEFLKSPSTADFPNITEWKFHKDREKIMIQSYVDSQNSFGATIRSEFQITLTPDGKTATSLIIDGKEYTNK